MHEFNDECIKNRHFCDRCKHEQKSMNEQPCTQCLLENKCSFEEKGEEK